ncbi:MAG: hypothetical protein E7491_06400 [Ruminococcaceae bacterium]|nr:hypothetical protein [Oscillospiraceae bacterium]
MAVRNYFGFSPELLALSDKAETLARPYFDRIDEIAMANQMKVLSAFRNKCVSESHFTPSTGYGYSDRGREVLDEVYAEIFAAEAALVRHNIVSGTHALAIGLFGALSPGDKMLAVTGKPYDTLEEVIGISGDDPHSLVGYGVIYDQLELLNDGTIDYDGLSEKLKEKTRMVYLQRSRGYSTRPTLTVEEIGKLCKFVKAIDKDIIIMVDNCYGEFVELSEPTEVGADLICGSLIKNPGGGMADTGGYVAGRADLVEAAACRLTAPGIGSHCGASLGQNRNMFKGIFMAPHIVAQAVKTAVFAAALFELMGYETLPRYNEARADIIQAISLKTADGLIAFCEGIQMGAPIDSFVRPEPWDMPGYSSPIIMAAGAFTQGASIELSADGPVREPYTAFLQGGLTYESGKTGVLLAAKSIMSR